jgi:uncharacterized protein YecE (DUF72 family)
MARKNPPPIRLGTSSWSCDDWKGVFYSDDAKPADYLAEYARRFSTVEIDMTFYRIPSRSMVERWKAVTPEGFLFAAKIPQTITHEKFLVDCEGELKAFLDVMSGLGERLGPLLFQFPYFAKRTGVTPSEFLKRLKPFLAALPKDDFQFVVEVRNKPWIAPPLLDLLSEREIPLALIDHPWMHRPRALAEIDGIVTGPFAYIRWLGDRYAIEKVTKTWNRSVVDRRREMEEWIEVIRGLTARNISVFGYVNNHYSGYAPGDVEHLEEAL